MEQKYDKIVPLNTSQPQSNDHFDCLSSIGLLANLKWLIQISKNSKKTADCCKAIVF